MEWLEEASQTWVGEYSQEEACVGGPRRSGPVSWNGRHALQGEEERLAPRTRPHPEGSQWRREKAGSVGIPLTTQVARSGS